ncbi:ANTAR domain-containing response regulator [Aureimonas sp. D3]|uniref:ANTAR domain-containing response regulator n=1 Tax=Aureimonas sp. D3 TaxID=1638164 RepID=UPI000A6E06E3|nr:ANTAR domain-containing protein [Aureimonas sp. D3]
MSIARLVQNFSHRRALLASRDTRAIEALTGTLQKLGLGVEGIEAGESGLDLGGAGADPARDILFLDGDLNLGATSSSEAVLPAIPVIGLVGVEAPSRLRTLVTAGATAFLPKPVYGGSVYSALYLGVNEHARRARLQADVDELEARRRLRRHVIRAVVDLMAARGIDDETAYQIIRREAMRERLGLETYCERLALQRAGSSHVDTASPTLRAAAD